MVTKVTKQSSHHSGSPSGFSIPSYSSPCLLSDLPGMLRHWRRSCALRLLRRKMAPQGSSCAALQCVRILIVPGLESQALLTHCAHFSASAFAPRRPLLRSLTCGLALPVRRKGWDKETHGQSQPARLGRGCYRQMTLRRKSQRRRELSPPTTFSRRRRFADAEDGLSLSF